MKKLNWNGYLLFISMCTVAGMSNQSITILFGTLFGFILGAVLGLFFLLN